MTLEQARKVIYHAVEYPNYYDKGNFLELQQALAVVVALLDISQQTLEYIGSKET